MLNTLPPNRQEFTYRRPPLEKTPKLKIEVNLLPEDGWPDGHKHANWRLAGHAYSSRKGPPNPPRFGQGLEAEI